MCEVYRFGYLVHSRVVWTFICYFERKAIASEIVGGMKPQSLGIYLVNVQSVA